MQDERVLIHSWPVLILPAYTPLVEEAVRDAREQAFEGLAVPVVTADYLCAIALQTGRLKDYLRLYSLIQAGCVTIAKLRQLIQTHQLQERWNDYARRYA
ncbi:MAG: hypothetical protein HY017_21810 [Betaproteobacteria bacterium]|nr:hypothetical protein [Betaproteobacteria bacterium]